MGWLVLALMIRMRSWWGGWAEAIVDAIGRKRSEAIRVRTPDLLFRLTKEQDICDPLTAECKKYLKNSGKFSGGKNLLFYVHIYHAFHHVLTIK